jgi:hypothetical protein
VISLVCPTRYRPDGFAAMVESAYMTAAVPGEIQVVAYIDEDDYRLGDYRNTDHQIVVVLLVGQRCTLSDAWNRAGRVADGDVVMLCADDLRFRSEGWDTLVEDAARTFPDGIGLMYGRDGHADERMATHPFVTRRWVDTVGRFTAPYFAADYVDLWLHDVAKRVGRAVYLPQLHIEHMHPSFDKGVWDENHRERLERAKDADLPAVWEQTEPERLAEAERLLAVMEAA